MNSPRANGHKNELQHMHENGSYKRWKLLMALKEMELVPVALWAIVLMEILGIIIGEYMMLAVLWGTVTAEGATGKAAGLTDGQQR